MANGGIRANAGRIPKAEQYSEMVKAADAQLFAFLPSVLEKLYELAMGVQVSEINPLTKQERIYTRVPDRAAATYLVDRCLGKPTETLDLNAEGLAPVTLVEIVLSSEQRQQLVSNADAIDAECLP